VGGSRVWAPSGRRASSGRPASSREEQDLEALLRLLACLLRALFLEPAPRFFAAVALELRLVVARRR